MPQKFNRSNYSDKRSLASALEVSYKRQEDFVSSVYLGLKVCFSLISLVSILKLGFNAKVRLNRLREIKYSYSYEESRNKSLITRFDYLLSFEGEQRFMKDQDQMISRDIIRVIWRW